jgi:hypothetical protein
MSSRYAYLIAAVAAVSGLLFGFDTALISRRPRPTRSGPTARWKAGSARPSRPS